MPAKKRGAKKGGKKKKAARAKATEERDQAMLKMRRFLKAYPTHCAAADSTQSPGIMAACRESLDEEKIFTKASSILIHTFNFVAAKGCKLVLRFSKLL